MDNAFAYVKNYGICSGSSYSYVGYVSLLTLQNYINMWYICHVCYLCTQAITSSKIKRLSNCLIQMI